MVWIGALMTLFGVAGIVWSLVVVLGARRAGLDDAAMRSRMAQALPINVAAFLLSVLGLLSVLTGILLG